MSIQSGLLPEGVSFTLNHKVPHVSAAPKFARVRNYIAAAYSVRHSPSRLFLFLESLDLTRRGGHVRLVGAL